MRRSFAVFAVIAALSAAQAFAYNCTSPYQYQIGPPKYYEYIGNPLNTSASTCWTLGMTSPVELVREPVGLHHLE